MDLKSDYLTPAEAAEKTGYSVEQVRRLARGGQVTAVKWGNAWMIEKASLEAYIKEKARGPRPRNDSDD